MPIALDPNKTTWIPLPGGTLDGPALKVRFSTCREVDAYLDALDEAAKDEDRKSSSAKSTKALESVVLDWRGFVGRDGQEIPYGPGCFDEALTPNEKWRLAWWYPSAVTVAENDLKKSESPSKSAGAARVTDAPADAEQNGQAIPLH